MVANKILDTHIHLWPSTATSSTNHRWMVPGHILCKRYGVSDYLAITNAASTGFIYVETDRYLPSSTPNISDKETAAISSDSSAKDAAIQKLMEWAHEPLEELKFLRRIVEGTPNEGDGFEPGDGDKMTGCVMWAPFHLPTDLFDLYLRIAEDVSGPRLWQRVVGFRYLIQAIHDEATLRRLVSSSHWLDNILRLRSGREGKGWAFDVGVDTHRGGVWQLEAAADMVDAIRDLEDNGKGTVRFVLNHLCKPDLSVPAPSTPSSQHWLAPLRRCAMQSNVYMKLSGAFNEFEPLPTPDNVPELLEGMEFHVNSVFELFGPERVMFGSDWPVCNVGGPKGEENWGLWREVVERMLEDYNVDSEGKEGVWWRAGCRAYGVEI
jgi:L-rhamnono-1,4-lactonase